jgi:hypothetical protein
MSVWLTFGEAAEIARDHLVGASIGRSERVITAARASGEVRIQAAIALNDDGVVAHPSRDVIVSPERFNRDDLLDWLDRQPNEAVPKPKQNKRHPQLKQDRAREAIRALWPKGLPEPTALSNKHLCTEVIGWLKVDCGKRKIPNAILSDSVILRAAYRKK